MGLKAFRIGGVRETGGKGNHMKKTQVPAMTEVSSADEAGGIALAPTARQIARLCT